MKIYQRRSKYKTFVLFAPVAIILWNSGDVAASPALETGSTFHEAHAAAFDGAGKLTLGGSSPLTGSEPAGSRWSSLSGAVSHRLTGVSLGGFVGYTQSEADSEGTFDHPAVVAGFPASPGTGSSKALGYGLSAVFPGNRSAWEKSFRSAFGGYLELSAGWGRFSITEVLSFSRGVFDVQVAESDLNIIKSVATLDYRFSRTWTAEVAHQICGNRQSVSLLAMAEIEKGIVVDGGVATGAVSPIPSGHFDRLGEPPVETQKLFMDIALAI